MYSIGFDIFARDRASATFDKTGDAAGKSASKMQRAGALAGKALLGIAGAAALFGKSSVTAFGEAQVAQNKLEQAYAKFPAMANVNIEALRAYNSEMATKTRFDDDAYASGQAVLAQFGLTGQQVQSITPLLADYAAKTGRDLPQAAALLGKAFMGNTRALKEVGINYKSTGDKTKDMANIQALLNAKVGGFATGEGKTAAVQAMILKNQFGELQETTGAALMPALQSLTVAGIGVVKWLTDNAAVAGTVIGVITALIAIVWAINAAARAYAATQAALNVVMMANPIGLVILALVALAAAVVFAYKKSATFRTIVEGAWKGVGAAASWMWNSVVAPVIRFLVDGFAKVASFYAAMLRGLAKVPGFGWAGKAAGAMEAAAAKATGLKNAIQNIPSSKSVSINVSARVLTGRIKVGDQFVNVGMRAAGGPVRAGLPYIVGEREAELFVPDRDGTIIPSLNGGGGGGTTIVQLTLDGRILESWVINNGAAVQQSLLKHKRRAGNLGIA